MGKSAQLGLHTWLPDAMEGPTPVSALIHAATMVTAGVFMVARLSPLFEYAPTALGGRHRRRRARRRSSPPRSACAQNDIKRVIAYSTCTQLGYMFFAAGVGAYPAAMFHLIDPRLLQGAAVPRRGLGDPRDVGRAGHAQDGRRLEKIPQTYCLMWIGSLALSGIGVPSLGRPASPATTPRTRSSKRPTAAHTGGRACIAFWLGVVAAFLTAFYSWRLLFMTFHGKSRGDHHTWDHAHERPAVMLIPLLVLASGAALSPA